MTNLKSLPATTKYSFYYLSIIIIQVLSLLNGCYIEKCNSSNLDTLNQDQGEIVNILALFSGSNDDLTGLDEQLGRHVLKLASNKAKRLHPQLKEINLMIESDNSQCNRLNYLPNIVAEKFYMLSDTNKSSNKCNLNIFKLNDADYCSNSSNWEEEPVSIETSKRKRRSQMIIKEKLTDQRVSKSFDAIIGPSCDSLVDMIARMASYWNIPIYTISSISANFARKDIYTTLTRLSPSIDQISLFMLKVFQQFRWQHFSVIIDKDQLENVLLLDTIDHLMNKIRFQSNYSMQLKVFNLVTNHEGNGKIVDEVEHEHCNLNLRESLINARQVSRIVILLLNGQRSIRKALLCAYELKMNTGDFVFVTFNIGMKTNKLDLEKQKEKLDSKRSTMSENDDSSRLVQNFDWYSSDDEQNNSIARQMFELLLIFSVELPTSDEYNTFVEQVVEMANKEQKTGDSSWTSASLGPMAVALHDSLLLAVEALLRPRSGPGASLLRDERYTKGLMSNIYLNHNGDQELDYVLSDLEPERGLMRPVASYACDSHDSRQIIWLGQLHWPGKALGAGAPSDEPECGFQGDAERCIDNQNVYAVLAVLAGLVLLASAIAAVSINKFRKVRYQMQLDDFWWRIPWQDLEILQAPVGSVVSQVVRDIKSGQSVVVSNASADHDQNSALVQPALRTSLLARRQLKQRVSGQKLPTIVTTTDSASQRKPTVIGSQASCEDGATSCLLQSDYSTIVRRSMLAIYKSDLVVVKQLNSMGLDINRDLLVELKSIRELVHDNLARFVGLCLERKRPIIVYEYCSRGNLQDLLRNTNISIDWTLKCSILGDLVNGLNYIHSTQLNYHGRLKATNLVLDSRLTVKLTDFGLQSLYCQLEPIEINAEGDLVDQDCDEQDNQKYLLDSTSQQDSTTLNRKWSASQITCNMDSVSMRAALPPMSSHGGTQDDQSNRRLRRYRSAERYFWTAPELLRQRRPHSIGSKSGDIYSLAIIMSQILTRREPYHFGTSARPSGGAGRGGSGKSICLEAKRVTRSGRRFVSSASVRPAESAESIPKDCKSSGEFEAAEKAEDILDQIRMGVQPEPVRPHVPEAMLAECPTKLAELMRACWAEQASQRPSIGQVRSQLGRITHGQASRNYLDNLLERLQKYANNLEQIVDAKSADINEEKQRTEGLLYQLVPKFVADKLRRNEPITPQLFDGVTIYFSDIVGFEKYASFMSPNELVDLLNNVYCSFDSIISSFDVTKIEVILDQFLVAAGISLHEAGSLVDKPTSNQPAEEMDMHKRHLEHYWRTSAEQIARLALCIRDLVKSFNFRQVSEQTQMQQKTQALISNSFNIRIGIHSGKVCAGIVGLKRPKFCLIGDTVNVASRMHTNSKANKIQISADTRQLLLSVPGLNIESRGKIEIKGKGFMETFWLESLH